MSEIPEIEAIRGCRWFARPETIVTDEQRAECEEVVDVEDATRLLRTALDRQAREIEADVTSIDTFEAAALAARRSGFPLSPAGLTAALEAVAARFAPKEADPR